MYTHACTEEGVRKTSVGGAGCKQETALESTCLREVSQAGGVEIDVSSRFS
jgi:hypothetical protein